MGDSINNLKPLMVWKHFYEITKIPRPSGQEAAVIEYIRQVALKNSLNYNIDNAGNILIRKNAVAGKESHIGVVLQAHVDMVPQKNSDKIHDFTKDPIQAIIEGDWVKADNTTLGADNGMGVAAALAVLESENIIHGPLEVLLTINEEAGMDGAFGIVPDMLQSDILLNLDSEEEGELFVGCAGGVNCDVKWNYEKEKSANGRAFQIKLSGLKGGHSGIDIHLKRANANKVLLQLLLLLHLECGIQIAKYTGGNMRNAIPREAESIVLVPSDKVDQFTKIITEFTESARDKFMNTDPELELTCSSTKSEDEVVPVEMQNQILDALNACQDGVVSMSKFIHGVVETSTNLSIVTIEKGKGKAQLLLRSSDDNEKHNLAEQMKGLFNLSDADVQLSGEYPGWQPNLNSEVLAKAKSVYAGLYGDEPDIKVIHAGLECGIIGGKYPSMDIISFGPTIQFPHSPDEKVHIPSVERFWQFLIKLLEQL